MLAGGVVKEEVYVIEALNERPKRRGRERAELDEDVDAEEPSSEKVKSLMSPFCCIYDDEFWELLDVESVEMGTPLDGRVQLLLTDPPYNSRKERSYYNLTHDSLTEEDMALCVNMFATMLRPGGHGLIFCSPLQFKKWHDLSQKHVTMEVEDDEGPSQTREVKSFSVEDIRLTFASVPGHMQQKPYMRKLHRPSVVEGAVHFWRNGENFETALSMVEYSNYGHIPGWHRGYTNCIDNFPLVSGKDKVVIRNDKGNLSSLRPEQKPVSLMKELICKYSKGGDIVVDMFGGTFSTAKACLELPEHRIFVGCDNDSSCVNL